MVYMIPIWSATLVAGVLSTVLRVDDLVGTGRLRRTRLGAVSWSGWSRPPLPTIPICWR